jgi:hypothetical protein
LQYVRTLPANECFYYAHAKGVRWKGTEYEHGVREWTECMYRCLFEHGDIVNKKLLNYPIVGAFKCFGNPNVWDLEEEAKFHHSGYDWFFPGSFHVCRHDCLFGSKQWNKKGNDKYWIEIYPSFFFQNAEAGTILESYNHSFTRISELKFKYYRLPDWVVDWRRILESNERMGLI